MTDRTRKYPKLAVVVYDQPGGYGPYMASGDTFCLMCDWSGRYENRINATKQARGHLGYKNRRGASIAAWRHLHHKHRLTKKDGALLILKVER